MRGWIILAVVVLLLFLLTLIRVGGEVTYSASGLRVRLRLGRIWLTLIPRRPKKPKKPKKEKKEPEPEPEPEKPQEESPQEEEEKPAEEQRRGGLPIPLRELIALGVDAAGQTLARLQIDVLTMELLIGGKRDPAAAAMAYGAVYAGGGTVVPLLENTFYRIKRRDINAWVDFEGEQTLIWLQLALSIRIGQVLSIGIRLGIRFLSAYLRQRKASKQTQEGTKDGTEASDQ